MEISGQILKVAKLRALELETLKFEKLSKMREHPELLRFCLEGLESIGYGQCSYTYSVAQYNDILVGELSELIREDRDRLMSDPTVMEIISDFLVEKTCA